MPACWRALQNAPTIKNPRSKLRGIGGRKEADQKNAASCGEYVPKEIQCRDNAPADRRIRSCSGLRHTALVAALSRCRWAIRHRNLAAGRHVAPRAAPLL